MEKFQGEMAPGKIITTDIIFAFHLKKRGYSGAVSSKDLQLLELME